MANKLVLLAVLLAGCQSVAMQTRVTADGGEFTLFPATAEGIPRTVRDTLAGISQRCNGPYEVTSLGLSPVGTGKVSYLYLDLDGHAQIGPFLTVIAYTCRPPVSAVFNDRLAAVAAGTFAAGASAGQESCRADTDCPAGRVCTLTGACVDR